MSAMPVAYLALVILSFVVFGVGLFAAQLYTNAKPSRARGAKAELPVEPMRAESSRPPMSKAA